MIVNWYNRPTRESFDGLANVLRVLFRGHVYDIGSGVYAVFLDHPREIWCTKTAVRNHLGVLENIKNLSDDGAIRDWTRDGYIIAVDFYCDAAVHHRVVRREITV